MLIALFGPLVLLFFPIFLRSVFFVAVPGVGLLSGPLVPL